MGLDANEDNTDLVMYTHIHTPTYTHAPNKKIRMAMNTNENNTDCVVCVC